MKRTALLARLSLFVVAPCVRAQATVDSSLAAYINGIRTVDSHAHPMRPTFPAASPDTEYDALPLDAIPAFPLPLRLRAEKPEWRTAQHALYSVRLADTGSAYRKALHLAVLSVARREGEHFPEWVLGRIGTQIMLAHRIALGPCLEPPRFRWISFADAFMFPLDTRGEATRSPDTWSLYPREETLLHRYMHDLGVSVLPRTLAAYVAAVIVPTLQRQQHGGAEAAWLGTTSARRALSIALTGTMRDGEISRSRAEILARMVLRDNAIAVYHLHVE